jgi:hypothetical protein
VLKFLFSFEGELDRRRYLAAALPVFLIESAYAFAGLVRSERTDEALSFSFIFNPLRSLGSGEPVSGIGGLVVAVLAAWIIAALSVKRLRHAGAGPHLAAAGMMPMLQLPLIVLLSFFTRERVITVGTMPERSPEQKDKDTDFRHMLLGALAGMSICVVATIVTTLAFYTYGWGLFVATPVIVGMTAAYVARRKEDISVTDSMGVAVGALGLGALAILGLAVEGLICLAMAAPIMIPLALFGAVIGHSAASMLHRSRSTLSAIASLPLILMVEAMLPPAGSFVSTESVDVAASPEHVWASITDMGTIDEPPAAPFGWGLAYPIAGEIDGEGVGAIRRGVFSTGEAFEQVTVWDPGRELTFDVLSNPPALKELSPYDHVHAPHLAGYFTTAYAKFTLTPLPDGRTRLALETEHDLKLEPAIYWTPIAHWAITANKTRVLEHFAKRAEAMR